MTQEELIQLATRARDSAYAPYSKFQVGSALVLNDGRSFSGVNVENCSYGLTLCAERNAITSAVSHGAKPGDISHIVIVAHSPGWPSPCGACRQVMSEFMPRDAKVSLYSLASNETRSFELQELFPQAFEPAQLP
jgi:cytidine deaminase